MALAALATGYGRMSMRAFAAALAPLIGGEQPPIDEVMVCVRDADDLDELEQAITPHLPARGAYG